ncbi:MAG: cysteine hydrolase [Candidatus Latescibacterota bacterium]|nr:MAG: cysteine hydrolase [Candidatus Latescibacterota bacterium]
MLFNRKDRTLSMARLFGIRSRLVVLLVFLISIAAYAQTESPRTADAGTSLLIIDVQEFYFPGGAVPLDDPEAASRNVGRLLKKFRDEKKMIIHIGHNAEKDVAFHSEAKPRAGEKVIFKDEISAFNGTELLEYLKTNGIRRLVICGMQTHMCVEAAVRSAHDLGFECILVHDACATRDLKFEDRTIVAEDVHYSTLSSLGGTYATIVDTHTFISTY